MSDFAATRARFDIPEGVIYLNGNSLGPLPAGAEAKIGEFLREEWRGELIRAWNSKGWFTLANTLGDRIARLIGAPAGSVVVGETLSIRVFQALAAALQLRPDRKVILSDNGNFPSDLYVAQGLIRHLGRGHELRTPDPEAVEDAISDEVAVVMLTEVDYRSARMHDMRRIAGKAHAAGALVISDLAHSGGATAVDVTRDDVDFAVGCTYKYMNAGPGAPAFIYVPPRMAGLVEPILAGWHGHATPFSFDLDYVPAPGIGRMRVGTPPIAAFKLLDAALDAWEGVSMADVRAQSIALSELFIREVEARCPALTLASPREAARRGSHVSFAFAEGYALMQALIARGVFGDFRAPDIMRFGFAPLYVGEADVLNAVDIIEDVLTTGFWRDERFSKRALVT